MSTIFLWQPGLGVAQGPALGPLAVRPTSQVRASYSAVHAFPLVCPSLAFSLWQSCGTHSRRQHLRLSKTAIGAACLSVLTALACHHVSPPKRFSSLHTRTFHLARARTPDVGDEARTHVVCGLVVVWPALMGASPESTGIVVASVRYIIHSPLCFAAQICSLFSLSLFLLCVTAVRFAQLVRDQFRWN